jgi:hypothetical protein
MSSFLSTSCERRFHELEFYFCYGCHFTEPTSTDTATTKIKLCKGFAERLWGGDLTKPTNKFDSCGFTVAGNVVIPSSFWANAQLFFNQVKPPLFSAHTIEIVEGETNCFNYSNLKTVGTALFLTLLIAVLSI